jgi:hypothetical protein
MKLTKNHPTWIHEEGHIFLRCLAQGFFRFRYEYASAQIMNKMTKASHGADDDQYKTVAVNAKNL